MKKTFILTLVLILGFALPWRNYVALAQLEMPSMPEAPTAPSEPVDEPTAPSAPQAPTTPTPPPPTPTASASGPLTSEEPIPTPTIIKENTSSTDTGVSQPPTSSAENESGGVESNGNVGNTQLTTGDANLSALSTTTANTNSIVPAGSTSGSDSISITNSGNGTSSTNEGSITTTTTNTTTQTNLADVTNNGSFTADSGDNSSSYNVGDTTLVTGDANLGATVVTGVNTNLNGVSVAEFNIDDNHTGDIILAFPDSTSCGGMTICGVPVDATVTNTGNGADSTNTSALDSTTTNTTTQTNTADLTNNLTFEANTGDNDAKFNTGGDTYLETGDANITANVISFLNNNIVGTGTPILFGVVNIFGELVGDIIFPELGETTVANTGNGSGSTNTASLDSTTTNTTTQTNTATITNNADIDANTGGNESDFNTFSAGGNVLNTGDATVDANVINIANNNVSGDTWWVVLVNNAGQWFGKILGAEPGATYAGSEGTEFILDDEGNVIAITNDGNGAGSTNTTSASTTTTNTTTQTNTANLTNNIEINANTGGNNVSGNTGGTSSVVTGDTNVILNVLNFVNNNFSGKVVFTMVNVFGTWIGNVVTPGSEQVAQNSNPIGGPSVQNSNPTSESSGNTSSIVTSSTPPQDSEADGEVSFSFKLPKILGLGSSNGSETEAPVWQVFEDDSIQIPSEHPAVNLGSHLDIRWLYAALAASALIYFVRRPSALKRLAAFFGLL